MIIEGIMNLLKVFLLFIIGLFPQLPDMSWLSRSLDPVINVLSSFDMFLDIGVFGMCLLVLFVFHNIEFIWGIVMWVIRKIPGVE